VIAAHLSDRAAVPDALRRPAAWVAAIAATAVTAVGLRFEGLTAPTRTDQHLDRLIAISVPDVYRGFRLVEVLGDPRTVIVMSVLLALVAVATGRRRLAVLALVGPGVTGIATTGLKSVFDRTLSGELAYPSGHTGGITAVALVAALLLVSLLRADVVTGTLMVVIIAVGAGGLMAVALSVLGIHYPTDTIGGFGTAVAAVLGCGLLIDRLGDMVARRRGETRPLIS